MQTATLTALLGTASRYGYASCGKTAVRLLLRDLPALLILTRRRNQPASFIDLTSSDDDEAQALATQIQPSQALASQVAQDLLPSNHGLPLQGAFTQNQCGGTNNGDGPAFNTCEPTVGGFGARPQTSIRPQTNNPNAGRRSTAQSFPRTIITATDRRMSVEENPAKKRKTHGGSGMTLKPYGGGLISQETPAAASGRALSTQLPKGSPASESTSPQDIQRVPVAVRLRADKLRVPLNGRGQNAQNLPRASVPISQQPDKIYDVICQQVVEHINSALDQYRSSISKADRRSIGGWVSFSFHIVGDRAWRATAAPIQLRHLLILALISIEWLTTLRSQKNWSEATILWRISCQTSGSCRLNMRRSYQRKLILWSTSMLRRS
jgi:hypothetical protein